MNRISLIFILLISAFSSVFGQTYTVSGKIVNSKNSKPVELVVVLMPGNELWAVSDAKGEFVLKNVPAGNTSILTQSLGYVRSSTELDVDRDISGLVIVISEDNLSLDEVVITAQRKSADLTTSYVLDRTTIDHAQVLDVSDITSLLPGGKTRKNVNLALADDRLSLRAGSSEQGNASFGTAIEIDGVRIDNNTSMDMALNNQAISNTKGVSTRNISTTNIESVEVITGIAPVEYGDLNSGIVKIKTKKGKTPYTAEFSTKPHTKLFAVSKGFLLGKNAGVLNASLEHAKSNSDIASPYKTYDRNSISLTYSNTFNQDRGLPINFTAGIMTNLGGYDMKNDPDKFMNEYERSRDNAIRGNFKFDFLLNKSWITNLELSASFSYLDRLHRKNTKKDAAAEQAALHGREEGHFLSERYEDNPDAPISLLPIGNWYQLLYNDNKPINYTLKVKADWAKKIGNASNKLMLGAEFKSSGNEGKGQYYEDMKYAPSWREYRYKDQPYINNMALYLSESFTLPVMEESSLQITAGLRSDITSISQSEYGTVANLSPRFNAKYIFWERSDKVVKSLSVYAGWGKAVKLPSAEILYPTPDYFDILSFTANGASGEKLYGYYSMPIKSTYNPDLKWQYNKQTELGVEANILGAKVTLSGFFSKTVNPYLRAKQFMPMSYSYTKGDDLKNSMIPVADQIFTINRETGLVTVSDKNGVLASETLSAEIMNTYKGTSTYTNGSDVKRSGMEWTVAFPQIKPLRTTIYVDGNFYRYKGVDETLIAASNSGMMANGKPYNYVGYYAGTSSTSSSSDASVNAWNGKISREVNTNVTFTTHIPKIRLIISMKIEGSFYNYERNLSEYQGGSRSFVLKDGDIGFDTSDKNIYAGNQLVAVHPLYYSTWDEPTVKIPFTEKFIWAKENDPALYNELAKLIVKSPAKTNFNPSRISSYFTANLSVTKELGNFATISFYANNFLNTMKRIKSSSEDTEVSLYGNSMIPKFYYGLTLKLKI